MKIGFNNNEVAVLIKSFYELNKDIPAGFLPDYLYFSIAEELGKLVSDWDKQVEVSFFDWCVNQLLIYPRDGLSPNELESLKQNDFYIDLNGIVCTGFLGINDG